RRFSRRSLSRRASATWSSTQSWSGVSSQTSSTTKTSAGTCCSDHPLASAEDLAAGPPQGALEAADVKTHLLNWLSEIGSSYWLVPTILTVGAIALASVMVQLDGAISPQDLPALPGLSNLVQASGARELLATVAGSIITVTSLVFSLTMVVLQMASQQFGSRLVGNFMRDRTNQWVLGLFLATFAYCLWVLRTVRAEVEST